MYLDFFVGQRTLESEKFGNVAVFTHRQQDKDRKAKGSTDIGSQSEGD